jgi:hypothetical protein
MLLEDILLAVALGVVVLMVGRPILRLIKAAPSRPKDPLAEAQERLRLAKLEAEAARVNREAEKIYEQLYEETLAPGADAPPGGPRIAPEPESAQTTDQDIEKGKRHGQG